MLSMDSTARFGWAFGHLFLVEPSGSQELYVWSSPDYEGGDNTIRKLDAPYPCNRSEWTALCRKHLGTDYVRDKGVHAISKFCGPDVRIVSS